MPINSLNKNHIAVTSTAAFLIEESTQTPAIFPKVENQPFQSRKSLLLRKYRRILTEGKIQSIAKDAGISPKSICIESKYLQNPKWQDFFKQCLFATWNAKKICYLVRVGLEQNCLSLEEAEEFARVFVEKNGLGLEHIPELRTPAICKRQ